MAFRMASEKEESHNNQAEKAISEPSRRVSRPASSNTPATDEPWTLARWKNLSPAEEPFNAARLSAVGASGQGCLKMSRQQPSDVANPILTSLDQNKRPRKAKTVDFGTLNTHQENRLSTSARNVSIGAKGIIEKDSLKRSTQIQQP